MIKTPVSFDVGDDDRWVLVGENGYHLPIVFAREAVARLNAHDALVAALEKARTYLVDKIDHNDFETWDAVVTPINKALSAAKGGA